MPAFSTSILARIVKAAAVGRRAVSASLLPELSTALRNSGAKVSKYAVKELNGSRFLEVGLSDGTSVAVHKGSAEVMNRLSGGGRLFSEGAEGISLAPRPGEGFIGKGARTYKEFLANHPVQGALGAAATAPLVFNTIGRPFVEAATGRGEKRLAERNRLLMALQAQMMAKEARLRRDKLYQAATLARMRPELYQQLVAGRVLPDEAVAIGGQPNYSLVDDMVSLMVAGKLGPRTTKPAVQQEPSISLGEVPQ